MTSQKQQLNEQKMINHLSTVGILGNVHSDSVQTVGRNYRTFGSHDIRCGSFIIGCDFATFIAFLGVKLSKKFGGQRTSIRS